MDAIVRYCVSVKSYLAVRGWPGGTFLFIVPGIALAFALYATCSLWLTFGVHWGADIAFESTSPFTQAIAVTAAIGYLQ